MPTVPQDEVNFVAHFVEASMRAKEWMEPIRREVLRNYLVLPLVGSETWGSTDNPMNVRTRPGTLDSRAILKTSATHILVETLLSKLMLTLFGADAFVDCQKVGDEDIWASKLGTKILTRGLTRQGVYRTQYVTLKDMLLFGTSVDFVGWAYAEKERAYRSVSYVGGIEETSSRTLQVPVVDDVSIFPVDYDDCFPEAGVDTIPEMDAFARRFVMPAYKALRLAEDGMWDKEAVRKSIQTGATNYKAMKSEWRSGLDREHADQIPEEYIPIIGYELWGETAYLHSDKARCRKVTVWGEELVDSRPFPYAMTGLPFVAYTVNPVRGRFWGVSPGEVARFSQDFADGIIMCLAAAVTRLARPPLVYNTNAMVQLQKLMAFSPGVPIGARDVDAIKTLDYRPELGPAFQLMTGVLEDIKQQSGATGAAEGQTGPDREAATVGSLRYKNALDRPEMMASLIERDALPMLGANVFALYQQFLTTDDLQNRVGQIDQRWPVLADIFADFDIQFVGSRRTQSKPQKLQMLMEIVKAVGMIPGAAPIFPWQEVIVEILDSADLGELEAMVGNPEAAVNHIMMSHLQGGGMPSSGNGNGEQPGSPPAGLLPAQASGEGPVG